MRIQQFSLWTSFFVACAVLVPALRAQHEIHNIPPVVSYEGTNPDLLHPFIDPGTFNPDYQFFAPVDMHDYGGRPEPNTGWFAEYNRVYIWVTRPEYDMGSTTGDFTWGNRIDLGYMSGENHGWSFTHWHIDGPGSYDTLLQERINRYNEDDELNGPADDPDDPNIVLPERDRNNPSTQARDYFLQDSENVGNLVGFELNKTWRYKPLHYGSTVEPFMGVRYNKFKDIFKRDSYQRFDETTGLPVIGFPPPPDIDDITIEQLTEVEANFINHMVGGQLGVRWFTQKSRWDLSGEFRAFALQNFQDLFSVTSTERTYYPDIGTNPDVTQVLMNRVTTKDHNAEFVLGCEVRAEAAYSLTRDIRLNLGMEFMEFGRGIGRGNNIERNDEDLTMVGFVFGAEINR